MLNEEVLLRQIMEDFSKKATTLFLPAHPMARGPVSTLPFILSAQIYDSLSQTQQAITGKTRIPTACKQGAMAKERDP